MATNTLTKQFLAELEAEAPASRKCIERMEERLFKFKPHEKSMEMGYLTELLADIPKWVSVAIEQGMVDFKTWERYQLTTIPALLEYFDRNVAHAKEVLERCTDDDLAGTFYLKNGDQELMRSTKVENIASSLNHWVHHRGQLTVYLRLNDIPVPSIYGPSADEKTF